MAGLSWHTSAASVSPPTTSVPSSHIQGPVEQAPKCSRRGGGARTRSLCGWATACWETAGGQVGHQSRPPRAGTCARGEGATPPNIGSLSPSYPQLNIPATPSVGLSHRGSSCPKRSHLPAPRPSQARPLPHRPARLFLGRQLIQLHVSGMSSP